MRMPGDAAAGCERLMRQLRQQCTRRPRIRREALTVASVVPSQERTCSDSVRALDCAALGSRQPQTTPVVAA